MKRKWSGLCAVLLGAVLLTGCEIKGDDSQSGIYFDTLISIHVYDTADKTVVNDCLILCEKYENMLSKTIEGSDVYNINHAKGEWVKVDPDTVELIREALTYSELTQGAFDITIAPVSELWNVTNGGGMIPEPQAVEEALQLVDYKAVQIEDDKVRLTNEKAEIDLGGIAKGYIADKLKELLVSRGIHSAQINLGGNIAVIGEKKDKTLWNIGIQKPFAQAGEVAGSVTVKDKSVVTSGIYERYFQQGDKIYHHIMDATTGAPSESDLASATIIGDSSTQADALSTCCILLGSERAMELIESIDKVEAILITRDGEILTSKNAVFTATTALWYNSAQVVAKWDIGNNGY